MLPSIPRCATQNHQPHVSSDAGKKNSGVYTLCPTEDPRSSSNRTVLTLIMKVD